LSTSPVSPDTLTRQSVLFPTTLRSVEEEAYEQGQQRIREQMFAIADDLLYACITYGDGLATPPPRIRGFTIDKRLGYALLAFFVERGLGLCRLPYCRDRVHSQTPGFQDEPTYRSIIAELTDRRIDAICAELRKLYRHTQRQLAAKGVKSVTLRRCVHDGRDSFGQEVGYAELLLKLASACALTGRTHLRWDMDLLNSYGDDGAYGWFPVAIVHQIAAEDVLYCSHLIRSRAEEPCGPRKAVEDGEWVVLNRSPTGVVELPVASIRPNSDNWKLQPQWNSPDQALAFLSRFDPVVLRSDWSKYPPAYRGGLLSMTWRRRLGVASHVLFKGRLPA
jgi:hypothetical protein